MPRQRKQTADYFPHSAVHGKTMFIIESKYGITGYAFWFKLLELLCISPGHYYRCNAVEATEFLVAKTGFTDTETTFSVLDTLAGLQAIDAELWHECRVIWVQHLVDNLASMYRRRTEAVPARPDPLGYGDINVVSGNIKAVSGNRKTQSKGKYSTVKKVDGSDDFPKYIDELQRNRFVDLNVAELWVDCKSWYSDHGKPMRDSKRALNNWCKREQKIHPARGRASKPSKELPSTERLEEEWGQ